MARKRTKREAAPPTATRAVAEAGAPAVAKAPRRGPWLVAFAVIAASGGIALLAGRDTAPPPPRQPGPVAPAPQPPAPERPASAMPTGEAPLEVLEVAKAVMVTVELYFGPKIPTIAQALADIERRYEPADGQGRTFAILDAYGEPTPDGKLHMSMHVSTEKPGRGSIVRRSTGEVLWASRIEGKAVDLGTRSLGIIVDDGRGNERVIDGSKGPSSILDATVRDLKIPVRDFWPDGQERQVTFIYSACGCPVKVMVRRVGERTLRTKDLPVIFPDDPAAAQTIGALMKW